MGGNRAESIVKKDTEGEVVPTVAPETPDAKPVPEKSPEAEAVLQNVGKTHEERMAMARETAEKVKETPPAESETTPAEPETTPAEPETPPAEPETPPAEPETTPAEPETPPATPAEEDDTVEGVGIGATVAAALGGAAGWFEKASVTIREAFKGLLKTVRGWLGLKDDEEGSEEEVTEAIGEIKSAGGSSFELPEAVAGLRVSSDYQKDRMHPKTKNLRDHEGVDIAMPIGTPLTWNMEGEGEILVSQRISGGGIAVYVFHEATKTVHKFMHLDRPSEFKVGDKIKKGDVFAYSGNTGLSTGPHLHYEVHESDSNKGFKGPHRDPLPFIPAGLRETVLAERAAAPTKNSFWTDTGESAVA